jgi:hypothetical protein
MSRIETEKAQGPSDKDKENDTLPRGDLKNGPVQDRGCTDILCCLVFMAFIVVFSGVIIYGFSNGDPYKLVTTFDYDSMKCGIDPGFENHTYVYFPKLDVTAAKKFAAEAQSGTANTGLLGETLQYSVCVKKCPLRIGDVECKEPSFMKTGDTKLEFKNCIWYVRGILVESSAARYDSKGILGRFCVPSDPRVGDLAVQQFTAIFESVLGGTNLAGYINDIQQTQGVLYISIATAFVVGFTYLIVLRLCGAPIIYTTLIFSVVSTAGGGYMLY